MADCSQINNIPTKTTSDVLYDSTPLPCTDVNTCDSLNSILVKFDNVICNVKANVDIITEDVVNLTEDVMVISEDIVNIQNQLNICCPVTTSTTSTTSTSSTTTTTTTLAPTTTTTTTILCDCYSYEVTVTQIDLDNSDTNEVGVTIPIQCDGEVNVKIEYNIAGDYGICVSSESEPPFQYIIVEGQTELTFNQPVNTNKCCIS